MQGIKFSLYPAPKKNTLSRVITKIKPWPKNIDIHSKGSDQNPPWLNRPAIINS